jgi:hypothetical protein
MPRSLLSTLATVAAAGLLLGACGGESEEDRVVDAVDAFVAAGRDMDAAAACALLSSDQLRRIASFSGGGSCPQVLGGVLATASTRTTDVEIEEVRIEGRRATVEVTLSAEASPPRSDEIHLVEEGGEWKLATAGL